MLGHTAGGCGSMPCHRTELCDGYNNRPIGDMFRNEDLFRTMKLSGEQIKKKLSTYRTYS